MNFIIILISLALDRYCDKSRRAAAWLYRLNWLQRYLSYLPEDKLQGYTGAAIATIIPMLAISFVVYIANFSFPMLSLLEIFLLFYCLHWEDPLPPAVSTVNQIGVQSSLWRFEERTFAILFWFALLGPLMAVFYRLLTLLRQFSQQNAGRYISLIKPISSILSILDWLPVRLLGLLYALVGNFTATFTYWRQNALMGVEFNQEFLSECGLRALAAEQQSNLAVDKQPIQALIDRSLLLFIGIIFIFAWVSLVHH